MFKTKASRIQRHERFGYFFILPFILAFLIFQLYPILYTFALSFSDLKGWNTEFNFVGFRNYIAIFQNDYFLRAIRNTWIIWTINFIPQVGIALALAAWMTNSKLKIKGAGFFKVAFYLPNIITAASVAVLFYSLFNYPAGPVNQLLLGLGVLEQPFDFFRSKMATRGIVSFIQFWMWYGQTFIIISAAIMGINPSLYEAAMVDGASSFEMFRKITLPLIKPVMLFILVTSLVGGMQMFDIPFLLTNGNPDFAVETITMFIYKQAFLGSRNYYIAATASVLLFFLIVMLSTVLFRLLGEKDETKGRIRGRKNRV